MSAGAIFWDIVPYVTLAILIVGTWWRYRYDKFGWTTRSSQLYESRLLRIGSPLFHFGILVVIIGHVIGVHRLHPQPPVPGVDASRKLTGEETCALPAVEKTCLSVTLRSRRRSGSTVPCGSAPPTAANGCAR